MTVEKTSMNRNEAHALGLGRSVRRVEVALPAAGSKYDAPSCKSHMATLPIGNYMHSWLTTTSGRTREGGSCRRGRR